MKSLMKPNQSTVAEIAGPLNPPMLGDFPFQFPQHWGLGGDIPIYSQAINRPNPQVQFDRL